EHGQRHRPAWIFALPLAHRDEHEHAPYPGAGHHEDQSDIKPGAAGERRIKCIEYRGLTHEDWDQRHEHADDSHPEAEPRPRLARERTVERSYGDEIAEPHDEEGGHHVGHRDAVRRYGNETLSRGADVGPQWAAYPHLPGAEERGDQKRPERHPEMRKAKPLNVAHRLPSPPDPA